MRKVLEAESVEERLDALEAVLRDWLGSASSTCTIDLAAAEARLGIELPLAYRHFCIEQLSRRREFWRIQDPFLDPEALTVSDNLLQFMVENQSVVDWRLWFEASRDDPPVVLVRDRGTDIESETFTEFLVGAAIFKLVFAAKALWLVPDRRRSPTYASTQGGMAMTGRAVTQFVGVYSGRIGADDELKAQLGVVFKASCVAEIVAHADASA